jgi:hypothetical protein
VRFSALKKVHKASRLQMQKSEEGFYDHPLAYFKDEEITARVENFDKVKIAEEVITNRADFSILDLDQKMNELVAYIKKANRMN